MNISELKDVISFEKTGIYYSIFVFFLLIVFVFIHHKLKPKFAVPFSKLNFLRYFFQKIVLVLIFVLLVVLPLNISILGGKNTYVEKTVNVQLIYDVSLSMSAKDIKPDRFAAAKASVISLVNNLSSYNISMITFSGIPFIWSPFSDDTKAINAKLNSMNLSDFPPTLNFVGTAIGDALMLGISNLQNYSQNKASPGLIILITDGDSNKGSDPMAAARIALGKNIPIYTLGIGQQDYVVGYDHFDAQVNTKINIQLLEDISKFSGGKFYRVLSEDDFKPIFQEISKTVKSQEKKKVYYEYIYLNEYFISVLLVLLIIYLFIRIQILYIYFIHTKIKNAPTNI